MESTLLNISDEELMLNVRKEKDLQSFEILVERYQQKIFNMSYSFLQDRMETEDVVQNVFLNVLEKSSGYTYPKKFSSWIYQIAHNICIDLLRKRKKHKVSSLEKELFTKEGEPHELQDIIAGVENTPEQILEKKELSSAILKAIDSLPLNYKEIIILHGLQRISQQETAKILKCSENLVCVHFYRALKALQKILSES